MSDIADGERKPPALPPKPIRQDSGDLAKLSADSASDKTQLPAIPPKPDRFRLAPVAPPKPKNDPAKLSLSEYNVKHVVKIQALVRRHICVVSQNDYEEDKCGEGDPLYREAGFLQPLRANAKSDNPLITEENLKGVFSDIEVIVGYHTLLEKELEKKISAWNQSVKLGDIFLKIASFLKTYNQYIQHYKKANLLLADLNKNPEFAAMMEGIKDFLIMPVQRIPRYSMLLQDMVKNTWHDHSDYASLSAALKTILELASYVEEQQGENANVLKVLDVQNMLSGKVIEGTKLAQPARRYVRESVATKHERDGKQMPVHLFLFNDLLIWTKPKKSDTHEVLKLDSLITLIVKDAEIGLLDPPNHAKAMGLVTPQGASTVILANQDEKKQWQVDIRKFIKESNDKYNAVKKREGGDPPVAGDAMMDILNFQKVTPAAVHGAKKEEGSAIAREVGFFSDKLKSGFTSVLNRASGGSGVRREDEDGEGSRSRSGSMKGSGPSPRAARHGSMINVTPVKGEPSRSPRSQTISGTQSTSSLAQPSPAPPSPIPKLSAANRSLSMVSPRTAAEQQQQQQQQQQQSSPGTPKKANSDPAAPPPSGGGGAFAAASAPTIAASPAPPSTPTVTPATPKTSSTPTATPTLQTSLSQTALDAPRSPTKSPKSQSGQIAAHLDISPTRRREKKEKTKRGTLDTPGVEGSPRKEKAHHSRPKKDVSERPQGYGTMRSLTREEKERELRELRAFAPLSLKPAGLTMAAATSAAAVTSASPAPAPKSPHALALDEATQAKLARLKEENEEAARRLKKMQEKFGAPVENK